MSPGDGQEIRRIVVALDASPQSLAALDFAMELASRLDAELIGIFIEDINLLRMAQLPFVREVGHYSATLRPLDSPQIERQLRARARQVERAMTAAAHGERLRWSFRVARGVIPVELLAAALDADLVMLGKAGWSGRRGVGSTTRLMVVQSPNRLMVLQQRLSPTNPVIVAYDGSESGRKALSASRLVWREGNLLKVFVLAENSQEASRLQAEAQEGMEGMGIPAQYSWQPHLDGARLVRLARAEGCGVLVLPAESEQLTREALFTVLHETQCAVLMVR